ncbi:hypothetical protein [Streptomyces milbemycinicus]|uniref:Uncharacterized protein n=1 Tax=Streptomyces milbemycinicus TaxID=476552 RepID=A0ABW8LY00_9ACTN
MSGAVGVRQPAFDQMVAQFSAACGLVEQCAQALQWELSQAQLPVAPAVGLRSMVGRMRVEANDLRRRQAILHHLQATTAYVPQWTPMGTLWDLPDDISALQAGMDGGKAAELAKKAAQGDTQALSQLQKYGFEAGDPNFAKALLLGLGAKGVIELPASLAKKLKSDVVSGDADKVSTDRKLIVSTLKMLSKALAVGTAPRTMDPDSDFMHQLKAEGRAEHRFPGGGGTYKGYQSLSTVLAMSDGHPPFSPQFMRTIGRDMIDFDRTGPKLKAQPVLPGMPYAPPTSTDPLPDLGGLLHLGWLLTPAEYAPAAEQGKNPLDRPTDYLNGLMKAAAFSKEASQALLKDNLGYLLHDRREKWARTDHGTTLGLAMKVAMSDHDAHSMALFAEARKVLGKDIRANVKAEGGKLKVMDLGQFEQLSGLRYSLGLIVGSHLEDMDTSFAAKDSAARDYDALLAYVVLDNDTFWALANSQIARTRMGLDNQYSSGSGSDETLAQHMGMLGHIFALRQEMLGAVGEQYKKQSEANGELIKELVGTGIGYLPIPYANLFGKGVKEVYEEGVNYGYGKAGDWLAQKAQSLLADKKPKNELPPFEDDQAAGNDLVYQMLRSTMVAHIAQFPGVGGRELKNQSFMKKPPEQWGDPEKDDFAKYCRKHNIPLVSSADRAKLSMNNAHGDAVSNFADHKE